MSDRVANRALWLLFFINLANFYDRQILAAVAEPVRRELHLGDAALGWLSSAQIILYAFVGLPLGRLADRGSRARLLGGGVAVWSAFTALSGASWNYASLFVARLGVGVGEASCAPAANALIGDLFPPARRARALSIFMLGLPIGILLSNVVSGIVAKAYGWRMTFFVATIPGLLLAILAWRMVEPSRHTPVVEARESVAAPSFGSVIAQLLRIPTLRWIIISGALLNFNAYAVNAFMPAYLGRYHRLDVREANVITGLMLGGLGIVSMFLAGVITDRARRWRPDGGLIVGAVATAAAMPCFALAIAQPVGALVPFFIFAGAGWMSAYFYYTTAYAAIHDVVPAPMRASAFSVYFFAQYLLGGAFGTAMLGALSDHMARRAMRAAGGIEMTEAFRATGLHDAFWIVPCLFAVLAAVMWFAARTARRDMRAIGAAALALIVGVAAPARAQSVAARDTIVTAPTLAPMTPLPPEAATAKVTKFSFVAYGDTRGRHDGRELQAEHTLVVESMLATIKRLAPTSDPIRFVLQSGDAVFNGAFATQLTVSYIPLINRITQEGGIPYFLSVGNHDVGNSTDLRDPRRQDGLRNYFQANANLIPAEGSPRRLAGYPAYAFGYGNTFFIAFDSAIPEDETQFNWVRAQLDGLDRKRYVNIVAFYHHPAFSSGPHGGATIEKQAAGIRAKWMPLFRRHHVRMLLTGHEHLYEHWIERYTDATGEHRIDQIVSGGGGAPLYSYTGEPDLRDYIKSDTAAHLVIEHPVRPSVDPGANPFHYVIVHVDGEKLSLEVIGVDWGRGFAPYRTGATSLGVP